MVLLLFFSILAAVAGFVAGYSLASKYAPTPFSWFNPPTVPVNDANTPPSTIKPGTEPPVAAILPDETPATPTVPVEPPPDIPPPPPEETQPTEPAPPPVKVSPEPEAALKAFLSAPDWKSRSQHVIHPERMLKKMEVYHAEMPDGPTTPLSLDIDASHEEPEKGIHLFSYIVRTEAFPQGFPVSVVKTPDGWKVDWETFIEFRDDHFRRFAAGEGSEDGTFHLVVRKTHYFGASFPGSDKLTAFRIDPPMAERDHYGFVATGSDLHKTLDRAIEWGHPFSTELELVRKKHPDGKTHLEIRKMPDPIWRPQPQEPNK